MAAMALPTFAQDKSKLESRLDAARDTLNEIMATPDKSIPESILEQATCVAVVPGLVKGAFIFGAEYGQGVATCRTGHGWSGPVFIRMAAAGPVGRDTQASTNWKLQSELLTWSRAKGLFAGIDLSGVSVSQNKADTDAFYGAPHSFHSILSGQVPVPPAAVPFVRTVAKYFHEAHEQ
jgi:lipid-binding SYLF domain-containing protein